MKALVFAAGLGTRLRPLTNNMPKALVPVGGVPMLERVIRNLISYGFDEIIVNVHHFADQIIDFLKEKDNFGVKIIVSDERDELLETGGGILKVRKYLEGDEPFLVHNADILTDLDLSKLVEYHQANNADVTLLGAHRQTQRYLLFDQKLVLKGWCNKATGEVKPQGFEYIPGKYEEFAFGGIHMISPTIFDTLQNYATEHKFSIVPYYLSVCDKLKIQCYSATNYSWFDVGKMETLRMAEEWVAKNK